MNTFSLVKINSSSNFLSKAMQRIKASFGHSSFDVAPLLDRRCKASIEEVKAALDGELSFAQSEKLKIIRKHMENLENLKDTLESLIYQLAEQYQPEITLLLTVPDISSPFTAIRIIAEIGTDMSVFETAKMLCSWAGVTPQNNESAGKKKTTRISRAGAYLKPLLVQIALAVSNSNKHPEIKDKYHALKKRRATKKLLLPLRVGY